MTSGITDAVSMTGMPASALAGFLMAGGLAVVRGAGPGEYGNPGNAGLAKNRSAVLLALRCPHPGRVRAVVVFLRSAG
jgi:hypothetical protein